MSVGKIYSSGDWWVWDGERFEKECGSSNEKFTFDGSTWRGWGGGSQYTWTGSEMRPDFENMKKGIYVTGGIFRPSMGGNDHSWDLIGSMLKSNSRSITWEISGNVPDAVIAGFIVSILNKDVDWDSNNETPGQDDADAEDTGFSSDLMDAFEKAWPKPLGTVNAPMIDHLHDLSIYPHTPAINKTYNCGWCLKDIPKKTEKFLHCRSCDHSVCNTCTPLATIPIRHLCHEHDMYTVVETLEITSNTKPCTSCQSQVKSGQAGATCLKCRKFFCEKCLPKKPPLDAVVKEGDGCCSLQ